MKSHIFRHQSFITIFLATIFVFLIVIGFFFNQQIAEFFQKKYRKTEEQKRRFGEETKKAIKAYLETDERIHEKYKELQNMKKR